MSRPIGTEGLRIIKTFEGCTLSAYKCPAGILTIGYGHTDGVHKGMNISQSKAEQFLIKDCQNYANYVDNPSYVPQSKALNSNQRDALISFAFNCGVGNLKKLCNRALHEIPDAMLLYNKANGKVLVGLTRRRKAERSLFLKPIKESYNMMTIRKGSRGKSVKIWQIIVDVEPDGIFGAGTKKATENFQKRNGLTVDGIVGNSTWKAGLDIV